MIDFYKMNGGHKVIAIDELVQGLHHIIPLDIFLKRENVMRKL